MHTIRLRGPWNVEPVARFVARGGGAFLASADELPAAAKVTMPADWSATCGADFLGRVRYSRIFQTPTGLDDGERVFLVVEGPRSRCAVELNRKQLADGLAWGGVGRFEVTKLLEDHNHLEIVVEHPALDECGMAKEDDADVVGGLVGEVRLEIEE